MYSSRSQFKENKMEMLSRNKTRLLRKKHQRSILKRSQQRKQRLRLKKRRKLRPRVMQKKQGVKGRLKRKKKNLLSLLPVKLTLLVKSMLTLDLSGTSIREVTLQPQLALKLILKLILKRSQQKLRRPKRKRNPN